ncbi:hypothetical protein FNV43_RR19643 [Rhamnella rubrinervis]|uniref:Uncharacterized protein n=1 Tax=Rhamnella rubrinervis TaxID=2594499 RepID=A0A8K0E011_9ROSA|nr:hypothetical protein FNV43_RR19643 [Rhamnella rubrinervis]
MEDADDQKELQLLPAPHTKASSSHKASLPLDSSSIRFRSKGSSADHHHRPFEGSSTLDLQLSISLRPITTPASDYHVLAGPICEYHDDHDDHEEDMKGGGETTSSRVESLKWQATEQIRLAAMEKAYAERVRELTKKEMELAQTEFARARHMWERAREEVERAERMKERATRQIDSTCMEITCQSCRQRFRP